MTEFAVVEIEEGGANLQLMDGLEVAYLLASNDAWREAHLHFINLMWQPGWMIAWPCGWIFRIQGGQEEVQALNAVFIKTMEQYLASERYLENKDLEEEAQRSQMMAASKRALSQRFKEEPWEEEMTNDTVTAMRESVGDCRQHNGLGWQEKTNTIRKAEMDRPKSATMGAIVNFQGDVDNLLNLVTALEKALADVMEDVPTCGAGKDEEKVTPSCKLHEHIDHLAAGVQSANVRINTVIQRLRV